MTCRRGTSGGTCQESHSEHGSLLAAEIKTYASEEFNQEQHVNI